MSTLGPPSLLKLSVESLLRDKDLVIHVLKDLPKDLFPHLFWEAYNRHCKEILKAMVPVWPFTCLPLGGLLCPEIPRLKAVLDGIDVLLSQNVCPRRCKLRVLDLQDTHTGKKFWSRWAGAKFDEDSSRMELVTTRCSEHKEPLYLIEVYINLEINDSYSDLLSTYLITWAKKRKAVHLCHKKVTIFSKIHKNKNIIIQCIKPLCVNELNIYGTWSFSALKMYAYLLGMMRNLTRLTLYMNRETGIFSEEQGDRKQIITHFISQFQHLSQLRELYLLSPFIEGHMDMLFRCLNTPLVALSILYSTALKSDMIHMFQSPHITQLKDLCLRGVSLTSFSESLRALLEKSATTLQYLDLYLCGLNDSNLEAMLPALSCCFQLRLLRLHGNQLSMATLEKLLRCTAGMSSLGFEVYPVPLESFSSHGTISPVSLHEFCSQFLKILQDLGHSRTIILRPNPCPYCVVSFHDWEMMQYCFHCAHYSTKVSFVF